MTPSPAPKNFTDIAVAHNFLAAACYNYSSAPSGMNHGVVDPTTGEPPTTGTREQLSAWLVRTFGSGFGLPYKKSSDDGGYVPDAVNDNRGPANLHVGKPYVSPAVLQGLGLPADYHLTDRDAAMLDYVPALYSLVTHMGLTGAGIPIPVVSNAAPAPVQVFASAMSGALLQLAQSLSSPASAAAPKK